MQELLVDFITSLDGYGAAEGWPGFWGLQDYTGDRSCRRSSMRIPCISVG